MPTYFAVSDPHIYLCTWDRHLSLRLLLLLPNITRLARLPRSGGERRDAFGAELRATFLNLPYPSLRGENVTMGPVERGAIESLACVNPVSALMI